ncbi:MAG: hypothetical protein HY815_14980 [Candidatus Riflebacteria bacterium]|nr:hypothetical protein [Candidatus Riflebacteria bacterium]
MSQARDKGAMAFNVKAVLTLLDLQLVVVVLTGLCIVCPLLVTGQPGTLGRAQGFLVFFAAIGTGFMFVEISQIQRLSVFLGSILLILPMGLFMGAPFPIGMSVGMARFPGLGPWFWGVNGATSVCASVLAVTIAIVWNISTVFWLGVGCYVIALLVLARAGRPS